MHLLVNWNEFLESLPPLHYSNQEIIACLLTKYQEQGHSSFLEIVQWRLCHDFLVDPESDSLNHKKKKKKMLRMSV
jgi:hypothetical protein